MVRVVENPPSNIEKFTTFLKKKSSYSFLVLLFLVVATLITFRQLHIVQDIRQQASYDPTTRTFTDTFDGNPPAPDPFTQLNQNTWDVQVHRRDRPYNQFEPMEAMHGMDCSAPPASHTTNGTYGDAVFRCKNHLMTAINEGGYGAVYLTPNAMLDFTNGGTVQFELSTFRNSSRDWWDITISPFIDAQPLPLLSDLSQGVDLQDPNKNSIVVTTDNGEGSPNIKVVNNGQVTAYGNPFFSMSDGITPGTNEMATRQTFKLTVSRTHVKFERLASSTATAVIITEKDIPQLAWSQGVVQLGHHSYNPSKACAYDCRCGANTWHWDTVTINPAVPFSIIKTNQEFVDTNNTTVTFNQPAPANAYLRFAGICKVKVDGAIAPKMTYAGHPEHFSSYMVPVPEGKQNAVISFASDDWYDTGQGCAAKDFAIWSQDPNVTPYPTFTPTPIPPTPTPLPPGTVIKMGDTNVLTESDNGNGNLLVTQKATLSQTATLYGLSFYVTNASGNLRLGVYDASGPSGGPGQKVAETAAFIPTTGWNTADVIPPVSLTAGTYWLAYLPSDNNLAFLKTSNGTGGKFYSYSFGPLPQTFSTSTSSTSSNWSFYATLNIPTTNPSIPTLTPTQTPTNGPTPTPSLSPTPTPSFTSNAIGPSTVVSGNSFTINSSVTSTTAFTGNVIVSLYDPNGVQKATQQYSTQTFSAGQTKSYSTVWQLPVSVTGIYTVKIQVTDNTNTLFHYNSNALTFVVAAPTPTPTPTLVPTTGAWKGEYFNNRNLSGTPVLVRNDPVINFNWGKGSPASSIPVDNFSARWTKQEVFTGGAYTFTVSNDDGMIISVDGSVIYNNWKDQGASTRRFNAGISAGTHTITVLYYEHGGYAVAKASWRKR